MVIRPRNNSRYEPVGPEETDGTLSLQSLLWQIRKTPANLAKGQASLLLAVFRLAPEDLPKLEVAPSLRPLRPTKP
jgi:hypothetical protein